MESIELKRIWNTLAKENLVDKNLAKENIQEIITNKGNGVISKLQRKLQVDFNRYFAVVLFMPIIILFLMYRDSQGLLPQNSSGLGEPYVIPFLIEIFMIYALITIKRHMNFMEHTYNTGTLEESLKNVKSHFEKITKTKTGAVLLTAILIFIEVNTLIKIGGIKNMNFSFNGLYIFESYFSVFILFLITFVPFIVRLDSKRYAVVLNDLDQTIKELDEEE